MFKSIRLINSLYIDDTRERLYKYILTDSEFSEEFYTFLCDDYDMIAAVVNIYKRKKLSVTKNIALLYLWWQPVREYKCLLSDSKFIIADFPDLKYDKYIKCIANQLKLYKNFLKK